MLQVLYYVNAMAVVVKNSEEKGMEMQVLKQDLAFSIHFFIKKSLIVKNDKNVITEYNNSH